MPLRGKALRDKVVLRVIAIDRAIHFTILVLLGVAVLLFASHENSLRDAYYRILTDLQGGVAGGPVQNSGHVGILHELDKLFSLRSSTLRLVGVALLGYGLLEGIEAVGLWLTKRWAEYLTFLATTILLPLEIYEIVNRRSALKIIGFIVNLAVVIYLLYAKRLFGLRGGGAKDAAERARDVSWETIERATPPEARRWPPTPVTGDDHWGRHARASDQADRRRSGLGVPVHHPPSRSSARFPGDGAGLERRRAAGGAVPVRRCGPGVPLAGRSRAASDVVLGGGSRRRQRRSQRR